MSGATPELMSKPDVTEKLADVNASAPCPGSAAAWINQQSELLICVRTMLVGPVVVIREGHHVIGTGDTLEEAVTAAIRKQQNGGTDRPLI